MNRYRSKVSPITIGVNVVLYVVLLVLVAIKSIEFLGLVSALVVVMIIISLNKFLKFKYYLDDKGLTIIDKKKEILVLYKDIKFIERNSNETGLLHGYGLKKLMVSTGRGMSQTYLITPEKEDEFIEILEKRVEMAKKAQTKNG